MKGDDYTWVFFVMILEEIDFFVMTLEEEDFSLFSHFSLFSPLNSKEKEEEDADSN
ncbi:hypothetical protein SAMN05444673_6891 [Bacillus sp. OV166]|nr:hypothetical protein SAMN05444673_6891 [Bacillus sp. OV166]